MAFVATDWTIDRQTGNIRYTGDAHGGASPSYATVIELHRALQDFADDLVSSGNDELDITDLTPSERATDNFVTLINSFNIDATAAEHLYDGSIVQDGGDTIYDGLLVVGTVETGTQLQIVQNNALLTNYWGTGLNADANQNILLRLIVQVRADGADINGRVLRVQSRELSDSYAEFTINGTARGNNVAAISTANDLNNQTAAGTIAGWTITNTEGLRLIDVDGNGSTEEYYSEWNRGSQTINDLYEYTKWIQRRGTAQTIHGMNGEIFRGITHSFAYDTETGTAPSTNAVYAWGTAIVYSNEATGPFTVGEALHEDTATPVWKGRVLAVIDNGTTGTLIVDVSSGTVTTGQSFTGQTSGATADVNGTPTVVTGGGTMALLAVDDDGTAGNLYVQLLKGSAPSNNTRLYRSTDDTAYVDVNGSVTQRSISPAFIGQSTGAAILGAYGVGIESDDLSNSDRLVDLSGVTNTPPNNVVFTVSGLISGEDTVQVTNYDGVAQTIDYDQLTLNTTLNADNITAVVVTAAIPTDTPSTGYIRVQDNNGFYRRLHYSSWTGSTFTIDPGNYLDNQEDFLTVPATAPKNVYISYLDEVASSTSAAFTVVYSSNRSLFVRVRDGGGTPIKTFETPATLSSTGGSATAIRTSDL
jgi:hypothetical protein